jgi:hypothetical protein
MIGYEPGMNRQRLTGLTVTLLATAFMALGLAACGSDDDGSGSSGTTGTEVSQQMNGKKKEVTPDSKAPASAGDKDKNAPDDAISNRPGGPNKPASP